MKNNGSQAGDVGVLDPNGTYPIFVSNPKNGAVDVSRKIIPRITFSEPMIQATLNSNTIILVDDTDNRIDYSIDIVAGSSVALIPKFPLSSGKSYTIKFEAGLLLASGRSINLEKCNVKFTVS